MVATLEQKEALTASLENDRESAWEAARYDREQRDQITSRIRFGSVVFNAASLLTVINGPKFLSDVESAVLLSSGAFFLAGVITAGYSLIVHQTHLMKIAGSSAARAVALDRAVSLSGKHPDTREYRVDLGQAMDEAHALHMKTVEPGLTAIFLQNASTGAWLGGALVLALSKAFHSLQPWPWF